VERRFFANLQEARSNSGEELFVVARAGGMLRAGNGDDAVTQTNVLRDYARMWWTADYGQLPRGARDKQKWRPHGFFPKV